MATLSLMFHIKNLVQPTHATHRFRSGRGELRHNPNDGDAMINDAGKQAVKAPPGPLPLGWLP